MRDARAIQTRFVILAAPRSGSNMLCTMLGSHPSILCHHEIFNPKGIRLALPLRNTAFTLGTVEEREQDPRQFLQRVWTTHLGYQCVGFKLTHRQNETIFGDLLADATIAKVLLRRRNRLKTYVSHQISEALGEWEVYRPEDLTNNRPKVRIDPQRFLERVAYDEAYYNEIRGAVQRGGHASIDVCYESLFSLDQQNAILAFLGVDAAASELEIRSVKQNSSNLADLVENYDELQRFFAGTPFESEMINSNQ